MRIRRGRSRCACPGPDLLSESMRQLASRAASVRVVALSSLDSDGRVPGPQGADNIAARASRDHGRRPQIRV